MKCLRLCMMDVCVFSKPSAQNIVICKKFYELAIMVPGLCVYTWWWWWWWSCCPGSRLFIGDKLFAGLTSTPLVWPIENLVLA